MSINFSSLSETLVYMGKGMLGIFIVTAVIDGKETTMLMRDILTVRTKKA